MKKTFEERIQAIDVDYHYDLTASEMKGLFEIYGKDDLYGALYAAYKYGYLRGTRAQKKASERV